MKTLFPIVLLSLCMLQTSSLHAEETEKIVCGGWTTQTSLDAEILDIFQEGIMLVKNYQLKPLACATQVVAGLNYCFLCTAQPKEKGVSPGFAALNLYVDLQGEVSLTSFRLIPFHAEDTRSP